MIQLEEQFTGPTDAADGMRQSLEELLELGWSDYHQALRRCRKKFSEKSVHALRVESRRMLSILALLSAALPDKTISSLSRELKDRLKALSGLRDTHVQIEAIAKMRDDAPELEPFHDWFCRKERRLGRRLERELSKVRTGKATRAVTRLSRALHTFAESADETRNVRAILMRAAGHAFEDVRVCCAHIGPENISAIHRMRVAFKKFRYMVEALAKVIPRISERQLRTMQAYQSRMGEIQDVEVLLARAQKFANKAEVDGRFFHEFRRILLQRRDRLVKRFLGSADKLMDFWPPLSGRGLNRTIGDGGTTKARTQRGSAQRVLAEGDRRGRCSSVTDP